MFQILEECCTPKRGTKYSAYVDLFSREDVVIGAGETKIVKLGVKIDLDYLRDRVSGKSNMILAPMVDDKEDEIRNGMFASFLSRNYLEVALRSSLGVKGLIIANGIGIIDLDYPDEIGLIVHNPIGKLRYWQDYTDHDREDFKISKGDKVAQCTLKEHKGYLLGYESDVIREGGYGSTGN